jgi:alkylated DNA repair dioxygenase AlkB
LSKSSILDKSPLGLTYYPEFLSRNIESDLLIEIRNYPHNQWERTRMRGQISKRRALSFGWQYKIYTRNLVPAPRIPSSLRKLRDRSAERIGIHPQELDQVVVMRYPPGAGIGLHTDAPCFGPVVLGLSLASSCKIFFRRGPAHAFKTLLEQRSLIALRDEARYHWKHELPAVRKERFSILFRSRNGLDEKCSQKFFRSGKDGPSSEKP